MSNQLNEQLKLWIKYPKRMCMYPCGFCPFYIDIYTKCRSGVDVSIERSQLAKQRLLLINPEEVFDILL